MAASSSYPRSSLRTWSIGSNASIAACVGVSAYLSATLSVRDLSVACPTAEITGALDAAIALTSASELNADRSSLEPPPRPIMITSTFSLFSSSSAWIIVMSAPSPCTVAGARRISAGNWSIAVLMMSLMTAPVSEVTTPIVRGNLGSFLFLSASNSPSFRSLFVSSSNAFFCSPSPNSARFLTMKFS